MKRKLWMMVSCRHGCCRSVAGGFPFDGNLWAIH